MKSIKSLLNKLLGQKHYLRLTSTLFFHYFNKGWLRDNPSYYSHYFVHNLIQQGDTVIDIGGNLGYFTKIFSRLVGKTGRVYTVEPIELYRQVLEKNIANLGNVTVLPYALGEDDGTILMGNPSSDKHRHGLMRVLKKDETQFLPAGDKYEVEMKHPLHLFETLGKIDYIKCDIEGYEIPVIPLMEPLIAKQLPLMQIETEGENKFTILEMMWKLGYKSYYAEKQTLVPVITTEQPVIGDLLFIPAHRLESFQKFVKS
ncbi:MAG: FkbM family methyltransferase [Chitinophagaceae bacterium]